MMPDIVVGTGDVCVCVCVAIVGEGSVGGSLGLGDCTV